MLPPDSVSDYACINYARIRHLTHSITTANAIYERVMMNRRISAARLKYWRVVK